MDGTELRKSLEEMAEGGRIAWLVLDMDDGVLGVYETRREAVKEHSWGPVIKRHCYGPGSYEYVTGETMTPQTSSWSGRTRLPSVVGASSSKHGTKQGGRSDASPRRSSHRGECCGAVPRQSRCCDRRSRRSTGESSI